MEQIALHQLSHGISNETMLGIAIGLWVSWTIGKKIWVQMIPKNKNGYKSIIDNVYKLQKDNMRINKESSDNINKVVTLLEIICPIIERQSENVAIIKSHIKDR